MGERMGSKGVRVKIVLKWDQRRNIIIKMQGVMVVDMLNSSGHH